MSDAMREALAVQVAQAIHNIAVQDGRLGTPWTDKDKPAAAVRDTRLGQADAAIELVSRALAPQPAPKCKVVPGWHLCADSCAKVGECLHAPKSPALDPATVEALKETREALLALKQAVEASQKMNGREYIDLGIQVNRALGRSYEALLASPAPSGEPDTDWKDDPSSDERWNAGLDFGMRHFCYALGVDPKAVRWDAATETLDGDVIAVIWNILRAKMGEDWDPDTAPSNASEAVAWAERISGRIVSVRLDRSVHCTEPLYSAPCASKPDSSTDGGSK